jgi:NAD(P)-dependent dehydrogenase (short-subunit alcohol dehydrogenase family)
MSRDRSLAGRSALVTGATSGVGREVALALGRLGARVLVHGRDPDRGRAVAGFAEPSGRRSPLSSAMAGEDVVRVVEPRAGQRSYTENSARASTSRSVTFSSATPV